jgi:hypothetical protein
MKFSEHLQKVCPEKYHCSLLLNNNPGSDNPVVQHEHHERKRGNEESKEKAME